MIRRLARADDTNNVVCQLREHRVENARFFRHADQHQAFRMDLILQKQACWICKASDRLLKRNAVLSLVACGLLRVPLDLHKLNVTHFSASERLRGAYERSFKFIHPGAQSEANGQRELAFLRWVEAERALSSVRASHAKDLAGDEALVPLPPGHVA